MNRFAERFVNRFAERFVNRVKNRFVNRFAERFVNRVKNRRAIRACASTIERCMDVRKCLLLVCLPKSLGEQRKQLKCSPPSLVARLDFCVYGLSRRTAVAAEIEDMPPVREESTSIASFAGLTSSVDRPAIDTYVHAPCTRAVLLCMRMRVLLVDSLLDSQIVLQIDSQIDSLLDSQIVLQIDSQIDSLLDSQTVANRFFTRFINRFANRFFTRFTNRFANRFLQSIKRFLGSIKRFLGSIKRFLGSIKR